MNLSVYLTAVGICVQEIILFFKFYQNEIIYCNIYQDIYYSLIILVQKFSQQIKNLKVFVFVTNKTTLFSCLFCE